MAVVGKSQTEVTLAVRGIEGFAHRSEHNRVYHMAYKVHP